MNISEHVYDVIVDVGQAPALWITTSMPTGVCADDILLFASAMFLAQSQSSITCFFILAIVPPLRIRYRLHLDRGLLEAVIHSPLWIGSFRSTSCESCGRQDPRFVVACVQ